MPQTQASGAVWESQLRGIGAVAARTRSRARGQAGHRFRLRCAAPSSKLPSPDARDRRGATERWGPICSRIDGGDDRLQHPLPDPCNGRGRDPVLGSPSPRRQMQGRLLRMGGGHRPAESLPPCCRSTVSRRGSSTFVPGVGTNRASRVSVGPERPKRSAGEGALDETAPGPCDLENPGGADRQSLLVPAVLLLDPSGLARLCRGPHPELVSGLQVENFHYTYFWKPLCF